MGLKKQQRREAVNQIKKGQIWVEKEAREPTMFRVTGKDSKNAGHVRMIRLDPANPKRGKRGQSHSVDVRALLNYFEMLG